LHLSAEDLQPAMETFLSQLRSLVGINSLDQTFSFIEVFFFFFFIKNYKN